MNKVEWIKNSLHGLPSLQDSMVDDFANISELINVDKGMPFISLGDESDKMAIVGSGLFRSFYTTEEGKLLVRNFCTTGDLIASYENATQEEPSNVTIDALENSIVLEFSYKRFCAIRDKDVRWERFNRILLEKNYRRKERRAYYLVAADATKRLDRFNSDYPQLKGRLKKGDIASYLGITQVSLSRILHES